MTEELKTLKDLRHKDNKSVMGETYLIREDRLREEAIKIFKRLEELKKSSYFDKRDWFQNNFQENPVVVLRFLEWFFNIKEEDLKDE